LNANRGIGIPGTSPVWSCFIQKTKRAPLGALDPILPAPLRDREARSRKHPQNFEHFKSLIQFVRRAQTHRKPEFSLWRISLAPTLVFLETIANLLNTPATS
jgi:hypothetical protein